MTISRRRLLLGAPLTGMAAAATAADGDGLPTDALRDDLALWRRAVLERHPRWHGHTRLDAPLEAAFERTAQALAPESGRPRRLSRQEAFVLLSRINPWLRDGHTLLMPWLTGRAPDEAMRRRQFPMGVDLASDGTLRLRSHWRHAADGTTLAAGSALLRLNGHDMPGLLQRLAAHGHGESATLRLHMLTLMWPQWLQAVLGWQDQFELLLRAPDGRTTPVTVRADGRWQPERVPPERPGLQRLDDGSFLLRVPTLDVDDDPAGFARAVAQAFAELRAQRATRLVIDLRGNTGGQSEAGAEILRPLISRPVVQVSRAVERLNADNNGWFGWRGAPGTLRVFDLSREGVVQPVPEAERWRGRTVALVDELSYSATLLLATTLQDHRLATLVGRPTGGHANQTGNMMPTTLPASGFVAFIATRAFVRPSGDTRMAPLVPDIVLPAASGAGGAASPPGDDVLQRALAWLANGA